MAKSSLSKRRGSRKGRKSRRKTKAHLGRTRSHGSGTETNKAAAWARARVAERSEAAAKKYEKHMSSQEERKSEENKSNSSRRRGRSSSRRRGRSSSRRRGRSSSRGSRRSSSDSETGPINKNAYEVDYLSNLTKKELIGETATFSEISKAIPDDEKEQWNSDENMFKKNDIVWDNENCGHARSTGCAWLVDENKYGKKILRRFPMSDGDGEFSDGDIIIERDSGNGITHHMIHPMSKEVVQVHGVRFY